MTVTAKDAAAIRLDARRMGVGAIARERGLPPATVLAILGRVPVDPDEDAAVEAIRSILEPLTPAARIRILTAAARHRCSTCGKPDDDTPGAWVDVCTCEKETK